MTILKNSTVWRVLLFCLSTAVVLAISSRLVKSLSGVWPEILLLIIAIPLVLLLTVIFVRWEGLHLNDVGVIPGRLTIIHFLIGMIAGLFLAFLQPALVLAFGHVKLIFNPNVHVANEIILNFLLYFLVACREELAYRGYPLRSLTYTIGPLKSQIIIALIFALEHVAGGMTWVQAFLGSGVGAILFGITALKTKGIALPIGLHTAWNFGQWMIGFKNQAGIWQAVVERCYETKTYRQEFICYLLVMCLAILAFHFSGQKKNSNNEEPYPHS